MPSRIGKITLSAVARLEAGDELRDAELKGFGVRMQAAAVTYFVLTRVQGRLKRMTIGRHGSPWTPETARKEAARLLIAVRSGGNPVAERELNRQPKETVAIVANRFLELHAPKLKPRTREEYARLLRNYLLPAFGTLPIAELSATHVARAHVSWHETPRTANFALAVLSKIVSWAVQHGFREAGENPCGRIERYREAKRERYLSDEEFARLGEALHAAEEAGESPWVIGVVRMLVLTGARLSEIQTLRWDYVDLPRRLLRLPDSKTGAKGIVLNPQAVEVLTSLPRIAGNPWVFPGHVHGQHLVNIQKPWRAIRAAAGLDDVRLHDLRHTFASVAVDVGGNLPVIGHLLGHANSQTTARYAHVAPNPAQRVADAAGERISRAWGKAAPDAST